MIKATSESVAKLHSKPSKDLPYIKIIGWLSIDESTQIYQL